jgi:ankyrin repeat protein
MGAAMFNPNVSIIEWFFKHNVDTSSNYFGKFAIHFAASRTGNPAVLDCMLKHGFKTTDRTEDGRLPLHVAALNNTNTAILDFLASKNGFDINVRTRTRQVEIKKILKILKRNISEEDEDTNKLINYYTTPIHLAATCNPNVEVLRWFFDHHACVEKLPNGSTLLSSIAMHQSNPAFLDVLKKYGYDILEKTGPDKTALHWAAETNGSIPVFEWLKNNGLDINARDNYGRTPLLYVIVNNPGREVLDWFIGNGAIFVDNNQEGTIWDCFHLALVKNNESPSVFQWFLDQGVNINAACPGGNTILHFVAQSNCPVENIIWMLDHGADPNIRNNEGIPALDYLRKRKDWKKIEKHLSIS